jgi:hypothetical protein
MDPIERIYREWDRLSGTADVADLYAPDATFESPLVRRLMQTERGILQGREQIRTLFAKGAAPPGRHRAGYLTDGRLLIWEYPRETPDGDQADFCEVMEIEDGLIRRHRVYWGWYRLRT